MTEGSRNIRRFIVAIVLVVVLTVIAVVGYVNRQFISDQFTVWTFTPSSEVLEVKSRIDLTDRGSFVFLASSPTLEPSQLFNEQCSNVDHSEEGHVLGCFTGQSIHLFQVSDERLDGIVEVTAAHELLHAVYSRISGSERTELDTELRAEYDRISADNPELTERMSVYSKLSDQQFVNELHSVLGTEVAGLSPELEKHYATYFTDRQTVLDMFTNYHGVFTSLQAQAKEIESEMTALGDSIESRSKTYQEQITALNSDITSFNERARTGSFTSQSAFASERADLVSRASELETERTNLEADVSRYNELREKLISLDAESKELNRVIDSNLAPAPSL